MTDNSVWLKRPVILFGKYYGTILRSSLQGDGCVEDHDEGVWIKMCITCEPITYIMLNGLERITYDRITCGILYVYIKIYDILTDLKGSERPRITVIHSKFLGYGSLFGQGSIPTYYHFSPLSPQITDIIYGINKY